MADYALDLSIFGLTVSGGKVKEVNTVDDPDPIAEMIQRVAIAIKTHLGEWLFDTTLGLPYTEEILVKNPNLDQIATRVRGYLATRVEGVTGVRKVELSLNDVTRKMTWTIDVETDSGATGPFNVTVTP